MPGADEGGFAGFHDQVDDHFLKVFGNAILLSVVSAGVQLSQGNANNQTSGLTTQQTIAAALGQQLPVDLIELTKQRLEFAVSGSQAPDQGEHVLGNVTGLGLALDLGGQIVGGILETLGGDRADQKVKMIDDLLGEPPSAGFE